MIGAGEALGRFFLQLSLPHILVPFLIAAALQTVQGSRVVTILVAPSLLLPLVPELGLPLEIIILSIASGIFLIFMSVILSFGFSENLQSWNPLKSSGQIPLGVP